MKITSLYPFINRNSRYQGFFKYADSFPAEPAADEAAPPTPAKTKPGGIEDFSSPSQKTAPPPALPTGQQGGNTTQSDPVESETAFIQNVLTMLREDMRTEGQMRDDEIDQVIGNLGQASKSEVFYRLEQNLA